MARAAGVAVSAAEPQTTARPEGLREDVRLLAALADPIRLDMVRELASDGEVCGCGFRVLDRVSQPTVSHHLRILREAGLVSYTREHSYLRYRLDPDALARASAIVEVVLSTAAQALHDAPADEGRVGCCGKPK